MLCIAVFSDTQVEAVLSGPEGVMQDLKDGAIVEAGDVRAVLDAPQHAYTRTLVAAGS